MQTSTSIVNPLIEELSFGRLLGLFRKFADLTQQQLANRIDSVGYPIDMSTISKYELNERRPSAEYIPYFSAALKLKPRDEHALLDAYLKTLTLEIMANYERGKQNVRVKS